MVPEWDISTPSAEPLGSHKLVLCQQLGELTIRHFGPHLMPIVETMINAMEEGIALDKRLWSHPNVECVNADETGYDLAVTPSDTIEPEYYLGGYIRLFSSSMYRLNPLLEGHYFELTALNLVGSLWVFAPIVNVQRAGGLIEGSVLIETIKHVLPDGTVRYQEIREDRLSDFLKGVVTPNQPKRSTDHE